MKTLAVIFWILAMVAIVVAGLAFYGFIWMIGLGALSHIFHAPNLAISYPASVLVAAIFGMLFGGYWIGQSKK